jgi:hypothetical protein
MIWVLLAIVVIAVVAIVVLVALRRSDETSETFTEPVRDVDVDLIGGWVTVQPHDGPATITRARQWTLRAPVSSHEVAGGTLSLRGKGSPLLSGIVGYTVKVPAGVRLHVRTLSASVEVRGINGGTEVETISGNITLEEIGGDVQIKTDIGEVLARRLAAPSLRAATRMGSLDLAFAAPPDVVDITAEGADVTLAVPGGGYAVNAQSGSGATDIGVANETSAARRITVANTTGPVTIAGT